MIPDLVEKFTKPKDKKEPEEMSDTEVLDIAFPEKGEESKN